MARRPGPPRDREGPDARGPLDWLTAQGGPDAPGGPDATAAPAASPPVSRAQARAAERAAQLRAQASPPTRPAGLPARTAAPPTPQRVQRPQQVQQAPLRPSPPQPPRSQRLTVILLVSAFLLAAWAAACFVDSGSPLLVAATSLAPAMSVLALPVLAFAVAGRQPAPAVIAIVAALVPWILSAGSAAAGPGPTAGTAGQALRVMMVDGGDGSASAPSIVRTARSFGAQVLVVTRLTNQLAHELTVSGVNSVVTPRWVSIPVNGPPGAGLWSTGEITQATPLQGFSRPSASTRLATSSGEITLVVAHAGGQGLIPDGNWRSDLRALTDLQVSGPRVMAGDLGATPWHRAFRDLESKGWHEATDVLGRGLRPTWPSWSLVPFTPLEQVLVGGGAGVSSADTVTIAGTSHRALLVTVVLPARVTAPDT